MLALVLAQVAAANGTIDIKEKVTHPALLWVDGEAVGQIKKTHSLDLPAGSHELWFAMDDEAIYTYCFGTVEVVDGQTSEVVVKPRGCEGFTQESTTGEQTASRGGLVTFRMPPGENYCCAMVVDGKGKYPFFVGPSRSLNLAPGEHHVRVTKQSADIPLGAGILRVEATTPLLLTCSEQGCLAIEP